MTHKSYTTNNDCLQLPLGYTSILSYYFWKAFTKQLQEVSMKASLYAKNLQQPVCASFLSICL